MTKLCKKKYLTKQSLPSKVNNDEIVEISQELFSEGLCTELE